MQCSTVPAASAATTAREPELHRLIARGNIVTYRILTDWPAIISRCTTHPHEASWLDRRLRTALHSACTKRPPVDAIRALVEACGGRDIVEKPDKHGRTPLVLAVESGSPEAVVRLLLDIHPEAGSKRDSFGQLPLHRACYNRANDAVVRMLLEVYPEGAAICDPKGGTPLSLAIESGASDGVVRMLIDAHADAARSVLRNGTTPLMAAIRKRASSGTVRALLEANPAAASLENGGDLPLHASIEHQASASVVGVLCDAYPPALTARNRRRLTPLHLAVKWNSPIDVIRVLLDRAPHVARAGHRWVASPLEMACDCFTKTAVVFSGNTADDESSKGRRGNKRASNRDTSDRVGAVGRSWERVMYLLRASYHGTLGEEDGCDTCVQGEFAGGIVSLDLGGRRRRRRRQCPASIEQNVLNHRKYPEHDVGNPSMSTSWRPVHAAVSFCLPMKILQTAIGLFPHQVSERERGRGKSGRCGSSGRLPLAIACERGMQWGAGLKLLFDVYPDALRSIDPKTGLYPFMISAAATSVTTSDAAGNASEVCRTELVAGNFVGEGSTGSLTAMTVAVNELEHVNTIYELLLSGPDVLCELWIGHDISAFDSSDERIDFTNTVKTMQAQAPLETPTTRTVEILTAPSTSTSGARHS